MSTFHRGGEVLKGKKIFYVYSTKPFNSAITVGLGYTTNNKHEVFYRNLYSSDWEIGKLKKTEYFDIGTDDDISDEAGNDAGNLDKN